MLFSIRLLGWRIASAMAAVCVMLSWDHPVAEAVRVPRFERVAVRRLERIESIERRAELVEEMPPRPLEVRRLLRRGIPLSEITSRLKSGSNASSSTQSRNANNVSSQMSKRSSILQQNKAMAQGRLQTVEAEAPTESRRIPPKPLDQKPLADAKPTPKPIQQNKDVSPTAVFEDGTKSVLIRDKRLDFPNEKPELLPTPQ